MQTEPDLMWALRGAGTNFGVVTEFVFALHEVDPLANLGLLLLVGGRRRWTRWRSPATTCSSSPKTWG